MRIVISLTLAALFASAATAADVRYKYKGTVVRHGQGTCSSSASGSQHFFTNSAGDTMEVSWCHVNSASPGWVVYEMNIDGLVEDDLDKFGEDMSEWCEDYDGTYYYCPEFEEAPRGR